MESEARKRGLGWYSKIVYPLLVVLLFFVGIYYELQRIELWQTKPGTTLTGDALAQFESMRLQFLCYFFGLILLIVVWRLLVSRDKKKHPQLYRRY